MASDTLSVGTSPAITVQNQGFGLVFHASTDFLGVSCDGLFVRPPWPPWFSRLQAMRQQCSRPAINSFVV